MLRIVLGVIVGFFHVLFTATLLPMTVAKKRPENTVFGISDKPVIFLFINKLSCLTEANVSWSSIFKEHSANEIIAQLFYPVRICFISSKFRFEVVSRETKM